MYFTCLLHTCFTHNFETHNIRMNEKISSNPAKCYKILIIIRSTFSLMNPKYSLIPLEMLLLTAYRRVFVNIFVNMCI